MNTTIFELDPEDLPDWEPVRFPVLEEEGLELVDDFGEGELNFD